MSIMDLSLVPQSHIKLARLSLKSHGNNNLLQVTKSLTHWVHTFLDSPGYKNVQMAGSLGFKNVHRGM